MKRSETEALWTEQHYSAHDGLPLYARHYPAPANGARPVLCLPGLTRNSRDFHVLATHLSTAAKPRRDVHCLDYRGRGGSGYDRDWHNYTPFIELLDTLDYMTIAGLHEAAVIGTSRGGIIAMMMAVMRPSGLGACVLNDIGPVIETAGLARIIGYVGNTPSPANWQEAGGIAKTMNEQFFPEIGDAEWEEVARQWFAEVDGRPQMDYDPELANAIGQLDLTRKLPQMWPQFRALASRPTLVLRGERSDLLSEDTVAEMKDNHPRLEVHTVPEQGHAPLLRDMPTIERVAAFIAAADGRHA